MHIYMYIYIPSEPTLYSYSNFMICSVLDLISAGSAGLYILKQMPTFNV